MFYGCNRIEMINLGNFVTEEILFMERMFYNCNSLNYLNISKISTSNDIETDNIFFGVNPSINITYNPRIIGEGFIQELDNLFKNKSL